MDNSFVRFLSGETVANVDPFVMHTYRTLLFALVAMLCFGLVSCFILPRMLSPVFSLANMGIWIACGWFGLRKPIHIVFPAFIAINGLFLGMVASSYNDAGLGHIFFNSAVLTIVAFTAISLHVFKSGNDYSGLTDFLRGQFWVLMGGALIVLITGSSVVQFLLAIVGTVGFCAWILYDTGKIMERRDADMTPVDGAFDLFMDIIGLFSHIRKLMSILER